MIKNIKKIAVCLSGQLRTVRYALESQKHFFKNFEVDYFCHTWDEPNEYKVKDPITKFCVWDKEMPSKDDITYVFDTLNPKLFKMEKYDDVPYKFHWSTMFYSAMIANYLKKQYELKNNFQYDLVIKSRYDLAFDPNNSFNGFLQLYYDNRIAFNHLDIYVNHSGRMAEEYYRVNSSDVMYFGSSIGMDFFSDIYRYLIIKNKNTSKYDIEHVGPGVLMSEYANLHGIRLIPVFLYETVYRKNAIPLDPMKNFDNINKIGHSIYEN